MSKQGFSCLREGKKHLASMEELVTWGKQSRRAGDWPQLQTDQTKLQSATIKRPVYHQPQGHLFFHSRETTVELLAGELAAGASSGGSHSVPSPGWDVVARTQCLCHSTDPLYLGKLSRITLT